METKREAFQLLNRPVLRGKRVYRPWYLYGGVLNRINQRIARKNLRSYPRLAIFSFDNIGLVINLEGRYEADSLDILSRFLREYLLVDLKGTAIDIGANVGNHSVFFSDLFDMVLAFEPNQQVFELLKLNSSSRNILPLNFGLSSEPSTEFLLVDRENLGASRIAGPDAGDVPIGETNQLSVELRRLDDVPEVSKQQHISLIKIDVEGYELQVLEGAVNIIDRDQPVIVFEQGRDSISNGTSPTIDFLRQRRYQFFTIRNNFDFGSRLPSRFASLLLRMVFGFRKEIVSTSAFDSRFYEMIIAVRAQDSGHGAGRLVGVGSVSC